MRAVSPGGRTCQLAADPLELIRIFAHTPDDAERVQSAVDGPVAVVRDAAAVATGVEGDIAGLTIACRSWVVPETLELLKDVERTLQLIPVILVTDPDSAVARWLSDVRVSAFVWFDKLETQLPHEIT